MKYDLVYLEQIPRRQTVAADNPSEAISKLWDMIEKGKTSEKLTGLGHTHSVGNIKAENGDEFAFFDHQLKQYRWQGKGWTEAEKAGLIK
jgi:hypothetical protein